MFELLFMLACGSGLTGFAYWQHQRQVHLQRLIIELEAQNPLYCDNPWNISQYQVGKPGAKAGRWQRAVLVVTAKRLVIYDLGDAQPVFTIMPHEIQGFWRPRKYRSGSNEIWIHAQIGVRWHILKVRLWQTAMMSLVRALKAVATDAQVNAYRRRRPYIHRGPSRAYPAEQNLQGAWELNKVVELYLMPLSLVVLYKGTVQSVYDLSTIQSIAALKRMEGGSPDGLLRFMVGAHLQLAFALDEYEAWATDLAEAAKRTLEEPLLRKRKTKAEDTAT